MASPSYQQLQQKLQRYQALAQRLRAENAKLRKENRRLSQVERQIAKLQQQVAQLKQELARLQAMLEAAQRAGKRQSAPFSKGPPKDHPKKPGRKPGAAYGKKGHRAAPAPELIDEVYEAPLPSACPRCGGKIEHQAVAVQYQVDIPLRPIYRQFNVHIGSCVHCGRRVQGRHPLQTSDALGAAASQVGPNVQAALAFLNKRCGVTLGKLALVLKEVFGISLTAGGVSQAIGRVARRLEGAYQQIANSIRASPWAVPDETGWKVGGRPAWLHVVVGDKATCYKIATTRSAEPTAEVLGWGYTGVLVHDGYSTYGRFVQAEHQQCVGHVLRRMLGLFKTAVGGAVHFPREVIDLFKTALAARDLYDEGRLTEDDLADVYLELWAELDRLVRRPRQNAENATLAQHLRNHSHEWFWFLLVPGVDATNYRAEQALRACIPNRKVWGGNRQWTGTAAQEIIPSVIETCRRGSVSSLGFLREALCSTTSLLLPNL